VFGDIAKARSALLSAGSPQEENRGQRSTRWSARTFAADCRELSAIKVQRNFLRLQDELAGTENRIAVERKRYNDTLRDYNTYVQQFPNSFFRGHCRIQAERSLLRSRARITRGSERSISRVRRQRRRRPLRNPHRFIKSWEM